MSEDLIKREDAIRAITNHCENECYYRVDNWCPQCQREEFEEAIKAVPSADRPQGEWIESFKRIEVKQEAYIGAKFVHDGWSCSECSEVVEKRYPNCPYCLARMKGADDD